MDDLEKAILLLSFEPGGGVDPELRTRAIAYCQQMRESPSICRLCVDRLARTDLVPVQFWCLQAINDAVRIRYPSMDPADRALVREFLISAACCSGGGGGAAWASGAPPFIRNKLAQALVALISFEYPGVWSGAFLDLLPHLGKGAAVIDMFSRVLNVLDDELISMEYPRSSEEIAVAGRIKDAMRVQCIPQIVRAWYDIVSLYHSSNPELAAMVLNTMGRYIVWIDIGLVANDVFVPLLFDLILTEGLHEKLRVAAASCLLAVLSKRMDPKRKLSLLQSLRINRVFGLVTGYAAEDEPDVVSKLGALVTAYAAEALDCSKRLGSGGVDGVSMELLEGVLPSVLYVIQNCEVNSAFNTVEFLSDYVFTMKTPSPKQVAYLGQILEVMRMQICYNPLYRENLELPDKIGREEEDQMAEHRKDFFTLLRSICRVAPDVTQLFIRDLLTRALASVEMDVEEVEVALSLFYRLGETVSDEEMRTGAGLLKEMIPMLLSGRFSYHSHRIVALVYLETVTRYMKFVQENTQYIPLALAAFLDQRGIYHQNVNVSRRASYLFMRAVKLLKSSLLPFIETILQSLQDVVPRYTSLGWPSKDLKCSGSEDGTHMFEAIGLLIGMEDISQEKQSEYLSAWLTPLCRQVETLLVDASTHVPEESFSKVACIQQVIMAINALSKGFSERLVTASRPAIGAMFKQTLDVLLQTFVVFPNVEPLRYKITSFLHRMVEILGPSVFPYLPMAFEKLLAESEPKGMVEFLLLINQLICKFNTAVAGIVESIFPAMANRLFSILPKESFPSGPGSNTEDMLAQAHRAEEGKLRHWLLWETALTVADGVDDGLGGQGWEFWFRYRPVVMRDMRSSCGVGPHWSCSIRKFGFGFSHGELKIMGEIRELQELQKTFFTYLHVVATHDLSSILIVPKNQVYLDVIIQMLLVASYSHKDMIVRKTCVQIFVRFTKDWCDKNDNQDKTSTMHPSVLELLYPSFLSFSLSVIFQVPGFRKFIIETFATNCCLYSVLDRSFDLRDANTGEEWTFTLLIRRRKKVQAGRGARWETGTALQLRNIWKELSTISRPCRFIRVARHASGCRKQNSSRGPPGWGVGNNRTGAAGPRAVEKSPGREARQSTCWGGSTWGLVDPDQTGVVCGSGLRAGERAYGDRGGGSLGVWRDGEQEVQLLLGRVRREGVGEVATSLGVRRGGAERRRELSRGRERELGGEVLLFGEILMAQKVMYEKFGDVFLSHFGAAAHCSQDLVEVYRQKLQGNDIKALKEFYQSLIGNLRQQQNGSFIFR
ncbi:hypothetical protein Taro_006011 [Colocasia esculenta]|uniref:Exportin-T n=1 Tax=Colocasia esculenta TaxID=4460 RepID=A0A843TUT5_COLES|nr:hypothetical protein [Colocasia esculenta]